MKSLMIKTTKMLSAILLFGALNANAFTEGKDYMVLEKPLSVENNTLTKVFSYACPFCYKYDKAVTPKVVAEIDGLKYVPFHLKTKGDYGEPASKLLAVLVIKDMENGVDLLDEKSMFKKAKFAYYKAYHDKKERWSDGKDEVAFLKTGLDAVGMSMDEYQKELENPKVTELLKKWDESYDVAKIQGVPAFVVNGKYLVYTASIKSVNGFKDLIEELLKK
ncbi:protein disulfide oxidoreductase [Campylobacter blaseri]|uniref:Thiol:disulfide interchange protein DsbA n=1 Tax=Campylobacter blaseri TaxID=2042961 RepID=A0A2P8R3Q1_9BACT|nr:thiol:disulfide interchange protein DsbA/DsbL [Campylobacter blaseri]PSM53113.1 thiol:disulfide interchange protein [Campylobacter blaseri]PSM54579.1 thiol:disulfide interchange protein [Campylobacter blaseri]QKF86948.1 protein disulfide oxidoreductase [Campylobacter blaseri]